MAQPDTSEVKWTPELDVALFHSMHGHKPVGLNKNFHMACIQHKLQHSAGLFLSTRQIWQHLKTLYDLDSLENLERFPFPNDDQEFGLPAHMLEEIRGDGEEVDEDITRSKKSRSNQSSSLSPASSPINKSSSKRKRN